MRSSFRSALSRRLAISVALVVALLLGASGVMTASDAGAVPIKRGVRTVARVLTIDSNVPVTLTINGKAYVAANVGNGNYRATLRTSAGVTVKATTPAAVGNKRLVSWNFPDDTFATHITTVTRVMPAANEAWSVYYE